MAPVAPLDLELSVGPIYPTQPNPTHRKVKTLDPWPNPTHNQTELHTTKQQTFRHTEDNLRHIIS